MELVVLLALTMGVIGLAGRLPEARRVKRELARGRRMSLAALPDGKAVTVYGTVRRPDDSSALTAPLTNRPCLYWLVVFDEVGAGGDFRELGRDDDGVTFRIEAPNGAARVVPDHPRLAVPGDVRIFPATALLDNASTHRVMWIARRVCKKLNYPTTSSLRVTEYVIADGMEVTVRGWCTHEPDPEAARDVTTGYRGELPTRSVISGSRRARLMIG